MTHLNRLCTGIILGTGDIYDSEQVLGETITQMKNPTVTTTGVIRAWHRVLLWQCVR